MRTCEACGIKMPGYRRRYRHPETGALVCSGCHPNKPGNEGRPVGFHGSLKCEACAKPMGDAGLVITGGLARCADGCKSAATHPLTGEPMEDEGRYEVVLNGEVIEGPYQSQADAEAAASRRNDGSHARRKTSSRKTAAWSTEQGGEYHEIEVEGVGQATISMEFKIERATEGGFSASAQPTGRWEYDAFLYDLLPTRNQGVANTLDDAKAKCEAYLAGGQMTLASTAMKVVAHDSGDGQTVYHCPFCGAGQTVARSDGTVECGFCHTYFTVQVQPEHSSMPQTDPLTGQPLNMPGMPGDPAAATAPVPTPTQTTAPGGAGDFAPAGSGGAEGFAPAGQGPVQGFAPAGSARAASKRTAAYSDCTCGTYSVNHKDHALSCPLSERSAHPTEADSATRNALCKVCDGYGMDENDGFCSACGGQGAVGTDTCIHCGVQILWSRNNGWFHTGGSRLCTKTGSRQVVAWDNDEWDEQYDPQGEACTRCGGDGEIDGPCTACDGTGLATTASKTAGGTPLEGYTTEKRGEEWVLLHPKGYEVARSKDKALLEDYRLQRDSRKYAQATDTCSSCGLPIKNTEDWGWIVYPASQAQSDDPADCPRAGFDRAHTPAKKASKTAMYLTPDQVALPESSYLSYLAIRFADDREGVIQQVRRERASR